MLLGQGSHPALPGHLLPVGERARCAFLATLSLPPPCGEGWGGGPASSTASGRTPTPCRTLPSRGREIQLRRQLHPHPRWGGMMTSYPLCVPVILSPSSLVKGTKGTILPL